MAAFGVPRIDAAAPLAGGRANSSFLVTAGQARFVLTVCDDKGFAAVEQLVRVLACVAEAAGGGARILRTAAGDAVLSHAGLPVIAKTYVAGEVLARLDGDRLRRLGRALAALHALPPPPGSPRTLGFGLESFEAVIAWPGSGAFGAWLRRMRDHLAGALDGGLPRGLIHGDLYADNVVWSGSEPVIIDFEEAADYFLVFDLGMALIGTCCPDGELSLPHARSLLDGYRSVRRPTEPEWSALQAFAAYAATATACWRFQQYHMRRPGSPEAESHRALQRLADDVLAVPPAAFRRAVDQEAA